MAEQDSAQQDAPEAPQRQVRGKNARGMRTRRQLIDAAADCFAEYGYTSTRISDIVYRAGVSQGNFYRHFTSKDEIFLEALRPGLDSLVESSRRSTVGDRLDLATMEELTSAYLVSYTRNRHLLRVMREAAAIRSDEGFTELWLRQRASFVERTAGWLRRLHAAGRIAETDFGLLADVLGSAVEQMAYVHIGLAERAPRPEELQRLARGVAEVWHRSIPILAEGPPAGS
ncbi:TetR/AcrR family transcriptional regulator [Pseudonocardia sp. HH130629-09]|uniref:TetR/AcrR family transcriptional regulator n=1 Tax=Pseudonocardia sp. HH130629-09 TaxID=1641402 RepID=UPI0006CB35EA|nr:TetR/AcrR family transcriptional regulator [Pseudonocardia sp. HH130629-09]ALE86255.1 TetR family transcriptional regulator [Pseudonocardia sp. HH130629-09]